MKDKTLPYPIFQPFHPSCAKLKSLSLSLSFFHFKRHHPSPLLNKQTFVVKTMAFQAKLPIHYVFQSHAVWLCKII